MENYISINDHKIELSEDQAQLILAAVDQQKSKLANLAVGDTFKLGQHEFVVLEQLGEETAIICKDLVQDEQVFGKSNNYDGSEVDAKCMEFAQELANIIGWENIVLHMVDLTSDDGLNDYGIVDRRASLLTADRYRRYVETLDKHKIDDWWWLATPHSTAAHGNNFWVRCVSPSGYINCGSVNIGRGVRPFCILKSNIFVSK